jgi:hypothetical protein
MWRLETRLPLPLEVLLQAVPLEVLQAVPLEVLLQAVPLEVLQAVPLEPLAAVFQPVFVTCMPPRLDPEQAA